jgi:hypothetical protein
LDEFTSFEGTAAAAAADDRPVDVVLFLAVIVFWFVGRGTLHVFTWRICVLIFSSLSWKK